MTVGSASVIFFGLDYTRLTLWRLLPADMQVLSLLFDLMLFSSLSFLLMGLSGIETTVVLAVGGLVVPLCLVYRSKLRRPPAEITCMHCGRTISADSKFCRYCLTDPAPGAAQV